MYKIFNIAVPNDGTEEAELNRFLASHRIVAVRSQWVTSGDIPYEVFTIEYTGRMGDSFVQDGAGDGVSQEGRRPDYRKLLTQEQFVRYCKMRDARKKIAESEAVKAFVVFTNEQLAAIARIENPTLASLKKVDGIGEARVTKYGEKILTALTEEDSDGGQVEPDSSAGMQEETT